MLKNSQTGATRRMEFGRDTFAFENETFWEYYFEDATGKTLHRPRVPAPTYGHRCFVLTRAARQFFYHAHFDPSQPAADDSACRRFIREVMERHPRLPSPPGGQIVIPGYKSLGEFSRAREPLLKAECGGAWRSYVLRSHWRMVFPISREHQARTAASMLDAAGRNIPPIAHIVKFPALSINHSLLLFGAAKSDGGIEFQGYDPNLPKQPIRLFFDRRKSTFDFPRNHYWAGGAVDIIEICRNWLM